MSNRIQEVKRLIQIKTALISVSDKTGLEELATFLQKQGVEIIATGGTARFIRNLGIEIKEVSEITGFQNTGRTGENSASGNRGRNISPEGQSEDQEDLKNTRLNPRFSSM